MSSDAQLAIAGILSNMWHLFTGWKLPGLGFTPAQFFCFLLIFPIILRFISDILSGGVSGFVSHVNMRRAESRRDERRFSYRRR